MPIVNGKVVRSRYTSLKLGEISSVDRPAQPGALASILKRHDAPVRKVSLTARAVAKYFDEDDGAHSFDEVIQANCFDEQIWPMVSALSQSVRSIMGDTTLKPADRETAVQDSVDEFLAAVRGIAPDTEKRLVALITKGTDVMNWEEIAKAAQAKVAELTKGLETASAEVAAEKAKLTAAEQKMKDLEDAKAKSDKALAEATEETIKVDGKDVKKSEVGAASFEVFKSLDNRARTAEIEKRVDAEFLHVVGTTTEKALVLKAADSFDEPTRKAFDAIIASAEKMATLAFDKFGHRGDPDYNQDVRKSQGEFSGKVADIAKRDNVGRSVAMRKAREENPDLFAKAYPEQAAN